MKLKAGKALSVPEGLLLSLTVNIITTSLIITILSVLLSTKTILWSETGYWIMIMLLISSFTGSKVAIGTVKSQRYLIATMSGILYFMSLLCITALFFGGQYNSVIETGILILSGSIAAALIHLPQKKALQRKRTYSYR